MPKSVSKAHSSLNSQCHHAASSEQVRQKSKCPFLAPREVECAGWTPLPQGVAAEPSFALGPSWSEPWAGKGWQSWHWQGEAGTALGHHSCSAGECVTTCSKNLVFPLKNSAVKKYGVPGIAGIHFIWSSFCFALWKVFSFLFTIIILLYSLGSLIFCPFCQIM